jgi:predicted aldo/keto reductase-like oxidoreductase
MVEAARAGVTYFDTAPGYFGEAFREMRRLGLPYLSATKTFSSTEAEIRAQVETQLARLGISAINFYHAWCITTRKDWEDRKAKGIVPALRRLKEEGLVRHVCVSSHLVGDEIRELLMEAYNHKRLRGSDAAVTERLAWHGSVGPEEAAKCTACGRCEEACTQHLPIIKRLEEIAAMKPHGKG